MFMIVLETLNYLYSLTVFLSDSSYLKYLTTLTL